MFSASYGYELGLSLRGDDGGEFGVLHDPRVHALFVAKMQVPASVGLLPLLQKRDLRSHDEAFCVSELLFTVVTAWEEHGYSCRVESGISITILAFSNGLF